MAAGWPVALVAVAVARQGYRMPFMDSWDFTPVVARAAQGQLGLADLWGQHNEHRLVFPRLLLLGLARLSAWDARWEVWANVGVALASLLLLASLLRATWPGGSAATRAAFLPLLAWLVFSMQPWENWPWGWQVQVWLNVLGAVVAARALAWQPGRWLGVGLAFLGATLSALSFACGLALLGLVPLALLADGAARRGRRALVAAAAGTLLAGAYLGTYWRYPGHPDPWLVLDRPGDFVRYVLTGLGGPLGAGQAATAIATALAGLVVLAGAVVVLGREGPAGRRLLLPWGFLAAYALAAVALIGTGRLSLGRDQALASRYGTIATLLWAAVVVLGGGAVRALLTRTVSWRRAPVAVGVLAAALTLALVGGARNYVLAYQTGRSQFDRATRHRLDAEACVWAYRRAPDECLEMSFPWAPAKLRQHAATLEALGLGPFAPGRRPPPPDRLTVVEATTEQAGGAIEVVRRGQLPPGVPARRAAVVVEGWVANDLAGSRPAGVVIVVAGDPVGMDRPGLWFAGLSSRWTWRVRFGGLRLPAGSYLIEAYAVLADGRRAVRLDGARVFDKRD